VSVSPDRAVATIKAWFAQLPDQTRMRSVTIELPIGRDAPNADGLIQLTRVVAENDEVVIDLDSGFQYRFRGLNDVRAVDEAEVRLEGFDELEVIWNKPVPQRRRYRDGDARFVSGHNVGTYPYPTTPPPVRE
jgi:hypothetical protein